MSPDAVLERAVALLELNRPAEAIVGLRSVLAADPVHVRAWCLLAQSQLAAGETESAIQAAQSAISLAPDEEWPYRLAAIGHLHLRDAENATALARVSVRLAPHNTYGMVVLAQSLARSKAGVAEARTIAERAAALAPNAPDVRLTAGIVAAADGRPDDARRCFEQALALDPQYNAARNELARLDMKRGRFGNSRGLASAADGFAATVRSDPRFSVGRRNLDVVLHLFLSRVAYGIFVIGWLSGRLVTAPSAPIARVVPALLLLIPAGYAYRFVSRLSPELRSYLRQLLRRRDLASAVICEALACLALIVGAVSQAATGAAFLAGAILALAGRVILWRTTRRRYPAPNERKYVVGTWLILTIAILLSVFALAIVSTATSSNIAVVAILSLGCCAGALVCAVVIYRRRKRAR